MKKINWKDFKIKDLKPNLIPNGWDSFVPHGNEGKETKAPLEVFNENYHKNLLLNSTFKYKGEHWSFSQFDSHEFNNNKVRLKFMNVHETNTRYPHISQKVTVPSGHVVGIRVKVDNIKPNTKTGFVQLNLVTKYSEFGSNGVHYYRHELTEDLHTLYVNHTVRAGESVDYEISEFMLVDLTSQYGRGNEPDEQEMKHLLSSYYANWEDIPEKDKPVRAWDNMLVGITPLGNGLTRIQTWGGSENGKLRFILNSEKVGEPLNLSMYINNIGSDITLHHDAPSTNDTIKSGHNGFFENITEVSVGNYKYVGIGTKGNLDFIASEPQLVESTKHNPVLIVDELEDGREHVQVHGAYVDTKLISKEVQGFSGEPYQIKTNIDNEGLELSMTSTLGDKSIDINKGSNSISHTGELKGNRIVVELGAKNE